MKTKHTQGPWEYLPPNKNNLSVVRVQAKNGMNYLYRAPLTVETEANAKLIAAAPELLEFAIRWYESVTEGRTSDPILNMLPEGSFGWKAQQLIKKATE